MRNAILMLLTVGMLSACSGTPKTVTYTDKTGKSTPIQTDRELCVQACNDQYTHCMDQDRGHDNGGVNGPQGMFGASADCKNSLKDCVPGCKQAAVDASPAVAPTH